MIIITESGILKLKTIMLIKKELFSNESLPRSNENEATQNLKADLVKNKPHTQIVL